MSEGKAVNLLPVQSENFDSNTDTIEVLEKYYQGKIIKADRIKSSFYPLYTFLKLISRYGNIDACFLLIEQTNHILVRFYTHDNEYVIQMHKETNHICCSVSKRKPRVGEYWVRGKDLTDSIYSVELFHKIAYSIVSYELKNLQIKI